MTPLVLVPGVGCGTSQFRRLLPGLGGLDVHPVELPGHRGAPPLPEASLEAVAARVGEQVPAGSVLAGHSTGGVVGLLVAVRHPGLLSGLVLLDANLPVTADALARKTSRAAAVLGPRWRRVLEESMRTSWGPREPQLREEVVAGILATPEAALRPLWHDVLALDPVPLLRELSVPTAYVRSSRDVDLDALRALNPLVHGVDLRGLQPGHWPHLTEPAAVLDALRGFLAQP
ncbi:alpha/beta fold hydrolase [Kineococcus rhizosphaerae]|uniref:Pimeloyl-ACP methyl ester carboxylesterase n=1 Tax=Kineococcus rhizosphaerae TaxID=559628 RepID=A0A2T0QZ46_9ACTN|nr:alpha/beta hydrolase [Kineococcus rhizosphaerae]PRY11793.1 pimeloyl-ACP methyl ester carboxylesterase [Kineococcus rhizosphaerae]